MTTDSTVADARGQVSTERRDMRGLVRRMAVKLSSGAFWQVLGHLLLDATPEVREAEVFSGIGFYARPKAGHRAEAIVVFPGGAANPIVIATRDEDARKAIAKLDEDATAMFNSKTVIVIKPSGAVEIRGANGTAHALPTLADFNDFVSKYNEHTHYVAVTGTASAQNGVSAIPPALASSSTGTTVLKAQ